jgi:ABC-type transporter Mla subunit MlaD
MLDQVLPKDIQTTLTHATRDIGNLAAALEPVAIEFRRMLEARSIHDVDLQKATANVDTLIQRFDATLRNFNEIIGNEENQANLAAAVANARKMTESGNAMIEEFRAVGADARPVLLSAAKLTEKLAQTTDDMSTVLRRLDQTMALVNDGTGTASLFLRDNRLYEELILTVKRMTKTLDDVRDVMELAKTGQLRIRAF